VKKLTKMSSRSMKLTELTLTSRPKTVELKWLHRLELVLETSIEQIMQESQYYCRKPKAHITDGLQQCYNLSVYFLTKLRWGLLSTKQTRILHQLIEMLTQGHSPHFLSMTFGLSSQLFYS
jgi:hypothetical protein